jgi:hypothetical protein
MCLQNSAEALCLAPLIIVYTYGTSKADFCSPQDAQGVLKARDYEISD